MKSLYRPLYHFSPPRGWANDPNGLVWHDAWWHLFYQHAPSVDAGAMHWGHAASRDLSHWQHFPIALYPDANGVIFSGSAAGRQVENGADELVACFTYASENRQTQGLAFSRDGGTTWEKPAANPVLEFHRPDFRDPKIFRHENRWIMVVTAGPELHFYASPDLFDWTLLSTFPAPFEVWTWECPDLFPLGDAWVLSASFIVPGSSPRDGSGTRYFLGDFDGTRFTARREPQRVSFGPDDYAAITWNDAPDGRRILLGWMSHWAYAQQTPTGEEGWRGAMTLPRELSLHGDTLLQNPPRELLARRGEATSFDENDLDFRGDAYEIEAEIDLAELTENEVGFALRVGESEATRVFYDVTRGELCLDRTRAGRSDFHAEFAGAWRAPLHIEGALKLRIFVDRCSVEVFAQGGALYGAALIFPSATSCGVSFEGRGARIRRGVIYRYEA